MIHPLCTQIQFMFKVSPQSSQGRTSLCGPPLLQPFYSAHRDRPLQSPRSTCPDLFAPARGPGRGSFLLIGIGIRCSTTPVPHQCPLTRTWAACSNSKLNWHRKHPSLLCPRWCFQSVASPAAAAATCRRAAGTLCDDAYMEKECQSKLGTRKLL